MLSIWFPQRPHQGKAAVQEVRHLFFLFKALFVSILTSSLCQRNKSRIVKARCSHMTSKKHS